MAGSAVVGITRVQVDPLNCDGTPDGTLTPVVYCGMTDVSSTVNLTDDVVLQDPSGFPGRNCLDLTIYGRERFWDVVFTTCAAYEPALDALLGYSDVIVDGLNNPVGSKAKVPGEGSLCECGIAACNQRVAVTIWSLNLCTGATPAVEFSPDGKWWVTVYSGLQFRPTAQTTSINLTANGKVYTARTTSNPAFGQGPGNIIPVTEAPFERHHYSFPSDVCPPGDCDCGICGSASVIAPLAV